MGREQQFLKGVNSATKVYVHKVWKDEHKKLRSDLEKLNKEIEETLYEKSCRVFFRPMTQKTLRGMRTRAKKEYVASDRARRENVPRHILFYIVYRHVMFRCKLCIDESSRT